MADDGRQCYIILSHSTTRNESFIHQSVLNLNQYISSFPTHSQGIFYILTVKRYLNKIFPQYGIEDLLEKLVLFPRITDPYSNESNTRNMNRLDQ